MTKYSVVNLDTGYVYTIKAYSVAGAVLKAHRLGYIGDKYKVSILNFARQD